MISLIAARSQNGAIGKDNQIPWDIPGDLAFFQRETLGGAIIMGRKTWESLPVKPLKGRMNIVVTSRPEEAIPHCVSSVEAAISLASENGYKRIYGIGGQGIYHALLPLADRLLISEVDLHVADADAFFPGFAIEDWHWTGRPIPLGDDPPCTLHEYLRKAP